MGERVKGIVERVRGWGGRRTRIALVVLLLAAGVAFAVWRAPALGRIVDAFAGVSWPFVGAALLANAASVTSRGVVWRLTLAQALREPPPLKRVLAAHWIGVLGNFLFPARVGEATRVGVLSRHVERSGAWAAVAGSAIAHRVLEAVPMAALILIALAAAPVPGWARTALLAVALGIGVALVVIFVAARRSAGEDDEGVVARVRLGLGAVREPVPTGAALLAATGAIGFQALALWLLLQAFGLRGGITAVALVLVLAELAVLFPLWPGNVGIYQGVIAAGLLPFGVPYATGLAYGLAAQALDALVAAAVGAIGLVVEGAGLAELRGEVEST